MVMLPNADVYGNKISADTMQDSIEEMFACIRHLITEVPALKSEVTIIKEPQHPQQRKRQQAVGESVKSRVPFTPESRVRRVPLLLVAGAPLAGLMFLFWSEDLESITPDHSNHISDYFRFLHWTRCSLMTSGSRALLLGAVVVGQMMWSLALAPSSCTHSRLSAFVTLTVHSFTPFIVLVDDFHTHKPHSGLPHEYTRIRHIRHTFVHTFLYSSSTLTLFALLFLLRISK